jgi:TldD protein
MEYEKLLSKYDYAELRLEQSQDSFARVKDNEVKHTAGSSSGMSVRVLQDGSWGFASTSRDSDIEGLLKRAERLSRLSRGSTELVLPEPERKRVKEPAEMAEPEEKISRLLQASKEMEAEGIVSRMVSCTDSIARSEFYSSLGSDIVQETAYTYMYCSAVAKSAKTIQRGSERSWSKEGFGKIEVEETARKAREKVLRLLDAAPPPKGRFTAVLDSEMTGVFSHEALGHACEADSVVDRESILAGKVGQRIGNELVSIVDDPTAWDFGHYAYDDEGVEAKRAVLVENGILKTYLNSMETAMKLGLPLNGHARSEGYGEVPIVRMSNTYFQRGESSLDDVFDVREGIYLKGMKGGSVDIFSGGFMFKAEEAYRITNGETSDIMRDVTITGNILQTMQDVESVGRDFGTSPGICGKFSQEVPVSDGGPHVRVKNIAVG